MSEQMSVEVNPNEADRKLIELKSSICLDAFFDPKTGSPSFDEAKTDASLPSKSKRPSSKKCKAKWSQEEDDLLYKSYMQYGKNWKKIAEIIKEKSPSLIKKRFFEIIYDGEHFKNSISINDCPKPRLEDPESLSEKEKIEKLKALSARMVNLQSFINETKQKLYKLTGKSVE